MPTKTPWTRTGLSIKLALLYLNRLLVDYSYYDSIWYRRQFVSLGKKTLDKDGLTALRKASLNGNIEIVRLLLEAGAHKDLAGKDGDWVRNSLEGHVKNEDSNRSSGQPTL